MVWNPPKLFQDGERLTARDLNLYLRDNLMENEVQKATTNGSHFTTDTVGNLIERQFGYDAVSASETAASNALIQTGPSSWQASFGPVNLGTPGPKVTITTGSKAIIMYSARLKSNTAFSGLSEGVGIDIPTSSDFRLTSDYDTSGPYNNQGISFYQLKDTSPNYSVVTMVTGLTPGINTFVMRYFLGDPEPIFDEDGQLDGWQTINVTYSNRHLLVLPL